MVGAEPVAEGFEGPSVESRYWLLQTAGRVFLVCALLFVSCSSWLRV